MAIAVPPGFPSSEAFKMLREGRVEAFNHARRSGEIVHLKSVNLRGADLRGMNADGVDFGDAYLHGADLRGIDLRGANLEGASIHRAKISGAYFPAELHASEIRLAVERGIRLRYRP